MIFKYLFDNDTPNQSINRKHILNNTLGNFGVSEEEHRFAQFQVSGNLEFFEVMVDGLLHDGMSAVDLRRNSVHEARSWIKLGIVNSGSIEIRLLKENIPSQGSVVDILLFYSVKIHVRGMAPVSAALSPVVGVGLNEIPLAARSIEEILMRRLGSVASHYDTFVFLSASEDDEAEAIGLLLAQFLMSTCKIIALL